jgi:hypothetical protein
MDAVPRVWTKRENCPAGQGNSYQTGSSKTMVVHGLKVLCWIAAGGAPLLLMGGLAAEWRESNAAGARPVAVLEKTEHNFGSVPAGSVLHADFPVTNAGRRRLVLCDQSIRWKSPEYAPPEIIVPPGDCRNVTVRFRTENRATRLRKEICYGTNDPTRPIVTLVLSAELAPASESPDAAVHLLAGNSSVD